MSEGMKVIDLVTSARDETEQIANSTARDCQEWRVTSRVVMFKDGAGVAWQLHSEAVPGGYSRHSDVFMHQWGWARTICLANFLYLSDVCLWRQWLLSSSPMFKDHETGPQKNFFFVEPIELGTADARMIVERDSKRCVYCGKPVDLGKGASIDHVYPQVAFGYRAGLDAWQYESPCNLVTACRSCNGAKGARPVQKHLERMLARGATPRLPDEVGLNPEQITNNALLKYGSVIANPNVADAATLLSESKKVFGFGSLIPSPAWMRQAKASAPA